MWRYCFINHYQQKQHQYQNTFVIIEKIGNQYYFREVENMLTRSDDLEILLTVIDMGGFSAAANALDIQVAKVSRAVSKIETQLGVTVLNRTTRRIELTEEGRHFITSVRQGIAQLNQAEEDIMSQGELPQGKLRVDAASPFAFHQLVPICQEFNQIYPNIQLEITSNEEFVDLLEKRTDVAIRIGLLADSTLYARSLGTSKLYIVASPEYLAKQGQPESSADLANHKTIGFSGPRVLNQWPLKGFTKLTPSMKSSNGETVRQLALAGNGIACLSGFMVSQDITKGRLVPILTNEKLLMPEREQVNAVYYKSSKAAKRITAFVEFIKPRLSL